MNHSTAAYKREWAKKNPEKVRAWRERYKAKIGAEQERERQRESWHRHKAKKPMTRKRGKPDPTKQKVRWLTQRAVRAGRLVRPERCQPCSSPGFRLHAHHHDYTKPLDVLFLCAMCHGAVHRGALAEEGK